MFKYNIVVYLRMLADNSVIHSMNLKIYLREQCIALITFFNKIGIKIIQMHRSYIDFCYERAKACLRKIAVAKVDH